MSKRISSWFKKGSKRSTSDSESSDDVLAANVGSIAGDNELLYASPAVMESVKHSKNSASGNNRIEFYSKDLPFFWLNNASPHPVVVDGIRYPTAEHLFQAQKFIDSRPDIATKIRKASNPVEAIHIARTFAKEVRPDWIRAVSYTHLTPPTKA